MIHTGRTHTGTSSFVMQRASAVILMPLALWFLISLAAHAGDTHAETIAWLSRPLTRVVFGAFVTIGAFHGRLGIAEVIEDYIHGPVRGVLLMINTGVALAIALAVWWALFSL